ncbi:MAG TPA: zf-HC2 domain-containing protein, partial [Candidatus Acidoferrales bacterium]|nr:zf-HC2 domain-containing protein [Candidatus Acidoferrales bacterium]
MSCERYRDWMTAAAAGDLQKNRRTELELHLNGCAGCRAEFQRVQILLNAIDFGVTAQTAAEPSLKLIESVRARIREESPVVAWWSARNARWIPAAACAAVLILAASIWTLWPRNQAPRQLITSSVTPSIAQAGRTPLVSGAATPRITPERNEPLAAFLRPARKRNVRRIERRQEAPEIIVQPGQMRALELFVQVMNSRQVDGA